MKRTVRLPIFLVTLIFGALMIAANGNTVSNDVQQERSVQGTEIQDSPLNLANPEALSENEAVTGDTKAHSKTPAPVVQPSFDKSSLTFKERMAVKVIEKKITKEVKRAENPRRTNGKSQLIALLLILFLGYLGVHRFYLGYPGIAIIQILTAGGCGIWLLIDLIRIITGDLKPKDGDYDETF